MTRVILVREWDAQVGSSGCCGRLGGLDCDVGEEHTFAHARADMEAMGAVYQALHAEFGDVIDLQVVDPRNTVWLVPTIWRDARARGYSAGQTWRQIRRGAAQGAVICEGKVLHTGAPPDPTDIVDAVRAELATSP